MRSTHESGFCAERSQRGYRSYTDWRKCVSSYGHIAIQIALSQSASNFVNCNHTSERLAIALFYVFEQIARLKSHDLFL